MARLAAVLDASVLYSMVTPTCCSRLRAPTCFEPSGPSRSHDEWERSLARNRPELDPIAIRRRRNAMNAAIRDAVIAGYEAHVDGLVLPDFDDRHVVPAAIAAHAEMIVTLNTKDFPSNALAPLRIEAQHPDAFLTRLLELDELLFLECAHRCRSRLKNPGVPVDSYLSNLRKAGLVMLAAELERAKRAL